MKKTFRGAAFAAAPFLIGSTAHAQWSSAYTAPRNATVDAAGARGVEVEAAAGELRIEGKAPHQGAGNRNSAVFFAGDSRANQADRRAAW